MAFFDKLKDVKDKAMDVAENATKKVKDVYDQKMEEQNEKRALQKEYEEEMAKKVAIKSDELVKSILHYGDDSNGGFYSSVSESDILGFTKEFFDKILLPANSVSKSSISMYPYISEKDIKSIKKSFANYDDAETPVVHLRDSLKQEFMLTTRNFYFKVVHPDDVKYFAVGMVPCKHINLFNIDKVDGSYVFKCDTFSVAELKSTEGSLQDFITLNNYFKCIREKDFDITNQEIDQIIQEKIGDKIYQQVKKYMTYDDELAIYFAWGLDSLSAKDYIVCTTKQIIIMDREAFGAMANVKQFYYEDITSVATLQESNSTSLTGFLIDAAFAAAFKQCDLEINVAGARQKINTLNKVEAERVIAIYHEYRKAMKEANSQPQVVVQQAAAQPDVLEQLEKLAKLKEAGILTEEEFTSKKADLLMKL